MSVIYLLENGQEQEAWPQRMLAYLQLYDFYRKTFKQRGVDFRDTVCVCCAPAGALALSPENKQQICEDGPLQPSTSNLKDAPEDVADRGSVHSSMLLSATTFLMLRSCHEVKLLKTLHATWPELPLPHAGEPIMSSKP